MSSFGLKSLKQKYFILCYIRCIFINIFTFISSICIFVVYLEKTLYVAGKIDI